MEVERDYPNRIASATFALQGSGGAAIATAKRLADWSAVGHELRTPLNAILGNVEVLLDGSGGPLSAEARACLGDVQAAGRHLMGQIDWLLLLAQVEAATPQAAVTVDLADLIRVALQRAAGVTRGAGAHATGTAFPVRGDRFWLEVLGRAVAAVCASCERPLDEHLPRLETCPRSEAGAAELRVLWPGVAPATLPPLPWRLADAIAVLHRATLVASGDGFSLIWPRAGCAAGRGSADP